jgi:tetratricopeptide (TPR) repeat protein
VKTAPPVAPSRPPVQDQRGTGPGGAVSTQDTFANDPRVWWLWLAGLALAAFALRLACLASLRGSPMFTVLVGDGIEYDAWATRLAAGDWLGREVFYQAPLYPYLLGLLYRFAGHNLMAVRVAQATFGAMSCVLLAHAGHRFFGTRVGLLAGALLACYPAAIFFDLLIQKASLDLLLSTALLAALAAFTARRKQGWLAVAGILLGLLLLNRENARLFYPVAFAWLTLGFRMPVRTRAAWAAWLTAGVVAIVLPVAVRNQAAGGEFLLTTAQMGPNFYIGNHSGASGQYTPLVAGRENASVERDDAVHLAEQATGHRLSAAQVSSFWFDRALDDIAADPASWLGLIGRKVLLLVNNREISDSESIETYAAYAPVLRLRSWLGFGVIAPLAALGLWLTRRRWRELVILHGWLIAIGASVVLFFVMARYRHPLVPVVLLFAASGIVGFPALVRGGFRRDWLGSAAIVAVTATVTCLPVDTGNDPTLFNVGFAMLRQGRVAEAIPLLDRSAQAAPGFAPGFYALGLAHAAHGDPEHARDAFTKAITIHTNYAEARLGLSLALRELGDTGGALREAERAVVLSPGFTQARVVFAGTLAAAGRVDDAVAQYRLALDAEPDSLPVLLALARLQAGRGQLALAVPMLERALWLARAAGRTDTEAEITRALAACREGLAAAPR